MKIKLNTVLAAICLIMASSLCIVPYYWINGFVGIFVVPSLLLLGLGLTVWLGFRLYKSGNDIQTGFQKFGFYATIVIAVCSLFAEVPIEYLDWHLRQATRNEIVQKVKNGTLKPNVSYNNVICSLSYLYFPPISNGGNDIAIEYGKDKSVTVEFYISRGFLDHYSAFVYTEDLEKIKEFEDMIKRNGHGNKKLENNWYRVSY
ncbi:MAG: hypothetical protein HF308_09975 [Ignavibacteria bacterium]|jgi:hypothetical protein|nr:hypothetical protein [Ignavibacteria bacterium]MCU7521587.1 hypothetical protein [Ignavibacteria bacterium]MCU7524791.1 hypothetical protein [Ignavibacteria bacterium]